MSDAQIVVPDCTDVDEMRRLAGTFDQGLLLAIPTETVYGLAAPVNRPGLVARIFELKGRPPDNPLIVHVATIEQARRCVACWPDLAEHLTRQFWPGPLTLVLPRSSMISDRITAGQETVALRMPDHPVALALINALDCPVVAPSANLFTRLSPTTASDVADAFDESSVLVLDGGPCRVGIESSIVALDEPSKTVWWLRPGLVDQAMLRSALPPDWKLLSAPDQTRSAGLRSPGEMQIHYRPVKPLHVTLAADAAELDRLKNKLRNDPENVLVELADQPREVARALYSSLRRADAASGRAIAIVIPMAWQAQAEWEGVLNRLKKAASTWEERGH